MKFTIAIILALAGTWAMAISKEEVTQKTADAYNAAADYSEEQKRQFQKDMELKMKELDEEIKKLKKTASEKSEKTEKSMR
jgi:predicted histidine transporter YuiF (NhaC family)